MFLTEFVLRRILKFGLNLLKGWVYSSHFARLPSLYNAKYKGLLLVIICLDKTLFKKFIFGTSYLIETLARKVIASQTLYQSYRTTTRHITNTVLDMYTFKMTTNSIAIFIISLHWHKLAHITTLMMFLTNLHDKHIFHCNDWIRAFTWWSWRTGAHLKGGVYRLLP